MAVTIEEMSKRLNTLNAFTITEVVQSASSMKTTISFRLGAHTGTITEPDPLKAIEHIVRIVMLSD